MKKKPPSGRRGHVDPNQMEFGIIWQVSKYPFKLRAGDIFRTDGRYCRVIRVSECAAVVIMHRPVREFKTRFDKPVRFQPPPKLFYISPQSEITTLNRKAR
jgi:hypothetical protein